MVRKKWIAVCVLGLIGSTMLYAQIRSATITGTVKDSTGAVVPDANVVVHNRKPAWSPRFKTTAAGSVPILEQIAQELLVTRPLPS